VKLIIQLPCLNEENTLPQTINDLPKEIPGVDEIETLIIDDGSTDRTIEVAQELGVNHIVRFTHNKGLAEAFMAGVNACLQNGADIIVNTDGDNQYSGKDVAKLIDPIIKGKADLVIGDRQVEKIGHFSKIKIWLQKLGSWVVRKVSNTAVPDTTSGFRALNREAALKLTVISGFTYTLETIIQAGKKNLAVSHVPIATNEKLRESRLFTSIPSYLKKSISTIFKIYTVYEPLKIFLYLGGIIFVLGAIISLRFLYFYFVGNGAGHIQSLILAAVFYIIGFQIMVIGLVADLIGANRRLIEDSLYRIKILQLENKDQSKKIKSLEENHKLDDMTHS